MNFVSICHFNNGCLTRDQGCDVLSLGLYEVSYAQNYKTKLNLNFHAQYQMQA